MCHVDDPSYDEPSVMADNEGDPDAEEAGPSNPVAAESSSSDVSSDSDDSSDGEQEPGEDLLAAAYKERPKAPPVLKPPGAPSDLQFRPESDDFAVATMDGDILL